LSQIGECKYHEKEMTLKQSVLNCLESKYEFSCCGQGVPLAKIVTESAKVK